MILLFARLATYRCYHHHVQVHQQERIHAIDHYNWQLKPSASTTCQSPYAVTTACTEFSLPHCHFATLSAWGWPHVNHPHWSAWEHTGVHFYGHILHPGDSVILRVPSSAMVLSCKSHLHTCIFLMSCSLCVLFRAVYHKVLSARVTTWPLLKNQRAMWREAPPRISSLMWLPSIMW